jgi:hypothetical protein
VSIPRTTSTLANITGNEKTLRKARIGAVLRGSKDLSSEGAWPLASNRLSLLEIRFSDVIQCVSRKLRFPVGQP